MSHLHHHVAPELTSNAEDIDEDSVEDLLMHSLHSIDAEITAVTSEDVEKRGMGTTLTALLIRNNQISLLHVGDSRCYRLRGNTLEQLSNDHTVIQELLDQGAITEAEAAEHPQRSMLTQALRGDGADGFECDVRLTKDNQLVLWHDSDMQRVAGNSARIADSTFSEIKSHYPQAMVLDDLLILARDNKKELAIETKTQLFLLPN